MYIFGLFDQIYNQVKETELKPLSIIFNQNQRLSPKRKKKQKDFNNPIFLI